MNEIYSFFLFISFMMGFFLSGGLFFKKENYLPNHILGTGIFLLSAALADFYFDVFKQYSVSEKWIVFLQSISFLYSPIFYIYTILLTGYIKKLEKKLFLHLIPAVLFIIYGIWHYAVYKKSIPYDNKTISVILYIQAYLYLFSMQYRLNRYSIKIRNYFSEIRNLKLTWLKIMVILLFSTWSLSVIRFLLIINIISVPPIILWLDPTLAILYIYYVAYCTLRQPEIFMKVKDLDNEKSQSENIISEQMLKTGTRDQELLGKLLIFMEKEKLYKNNSLTLSQLSDAINIPPHQLTRAIASSEHNFYSFINSYRISEAKQLLSDNSNKDKTVLELAFEAGFNSKTTFNEIFRKNVNMTPSEYRKKQFP